jgi:hypothetical protein
MNFRVAPEIFWSTDAFDYALYPDLVEALLASDASGSGMANPSVVYSAWYAATMNQTYGDLT